MRNILTSSLELNNFKIATIEASVDDTTHASVTVPTLARWYRKWDTVTLLSGWNIVIKTEWGDILWYIEISLDTWASIYEVWFNIVSMVVNTEYPLTEDFNYIYYIILYTPPTKRLSLYIETDWLPSSDWEWIDDNGQDISYVDMPVDYKGIFLTWNSSDRYDFIPVDDEWNPASSEERFIADPRWVQWVVFKWIKYVPYGWTAFDVDLTTTYQPIPMVETWGLLQDWDKMVMVFETQTGPSEFEYVQAPTSTDYTSQINSWYGSSVSVQSWRVDAVLQADDWYLYTATSYADWSHWQYYIEVMKISASMVVIEHSQVSTTYNWINAPLTTFWSYMSRPNYSDWTNNVDSSITNAQTLWEWIYNNLQ